MKIGRHEKAILCFILTLTFSLSIFTSRVTANLAKITVDVNKILSDVSNNPLGISVNFLNYKSNQIKPLKQINVKSLRFPEGSLAEFYLFDENHPTKARISVRDPNIYLPNIEKSENNWTWKSTLSFDDFIKLNRSLKAEPFVIVGINALAYTGKFPHINEREVLDAAINWVKYSNITKKYGVKYWEIGNENDLEKDYINWTPKKYARTVVKFSKAMKAIDPSIKIGANGMTRMKWWHEIAPLIKDDVDFLVTHQYSALKDYEEWKQNPWDYTYNLEDVEETISKYNPNLRLNVTEISSFAPQMEKEHTNNTWKMLHNFEILGNALRFNKLDYLHFWTSRWLEEDSYKVATSAFDRDYKLTAMGLPLKIWGNFLKKKMVATTNPKDNNIIRSWASYDPDDRSLNLFLLNKDEISQKVTVSLENYRAKSKNDSWILKGSNPTSTKPTWKKSKPIKLEKSQITTKLEPLSVTVISLTGAENLD
jgi:alpha-N-arabinofuranosidase